MAEGRSDLQESLARVLRMEHHGDYLPEFLEELADRVMALEKQVDELRTALARADAGQAADTSINPASAQNLGPSHPGSGNRPLA